MFKIILSLVVIAQAVCSRTTPYIGVLSIPKTGNKNKISASYIRWLEASGARVVAIHPWYSDEQMEKALKGLNGVLLQGSGLDKGVEYKQYQEAIGKIINHANSHSTDKEGNPYPIIAIGKAAEIVAKNFAKDISTSKINRKDVFTKVSYDVKTIQDSQLFSLVKDDLDLLHKDIFHFINYKALPSSVFKTEQGLSQFKVTSTFDDGYVASFEDGKVPIYGVQFHPQYVAFDRNPNEKFNTNMDSIIMSTAIADMFVTKAAENSNDEDMSENKNVLKIYKQKYERYEYEDEEDDNRRKKKIFDHYVAFNTAEPKKDR